MEKKKNFVFEIKIVRKKKNIKAVFENCKSKEKTKKNNKKKIKQREITNHSFFF